MALFLAVAPRGALQVRLYSTALQGKSKKSSC